INRIVIGWALFALVLVILAVVVIIPAFLAGPAEIPPDGSRAKTAALSPFSAIAAVDTTAFLSSTFPADDPARDSLPPSILPVVILKGSDYEMGFQYGEQAGAYIDRTREDKWASALRRFERDEVLRALRANQSFIKRYTPEWIDFMRGMAAGATQSGFPMTYTDVLLMNCTLPDPKTSPYPEGAEKDALPPKRCSVASAWGSATRDGCLIGLDTLDTPDVAHAVVIVAYPDRGNAYLCGADAGEIGDHFLMNNKGFFLGNSGGGGSPRPEDEGYGIAWACSLPYVVRFCDGALEARDMVMKWQINVPENFHFADVWGNACVVEKTAAVQAVRNPGDFGERDFLFSTNNYLAPEMKVTKEGGFVGGHGGYGAYAAPRNKMIWDLFHNYHGEIDVEFAKMVLRFPGAPPPWPPAGGWEAMFCRPTNLWTAVAVPDDGDEGIAHICTGPAGRVLHASIAGDGSVMRPTYRYAAGTHTFYRLRLANGPAELAEAAKEAAEEEIADAYGKLMHLNYRDAGYAGLKELYGRAVAEMFEGRNAFNRAELEMATAGGESAAPGGAESRDLMNAGRNRSLLLYGRAASLYARAQAHAREVYEALEPAPTSPSDLGLRAFGGPWAVWETAVGQGR
ncbi:MAG: hypothetical protein JXE07_01115, partial [Candidatus Aminicenantes bacterium]|nr:hypothetical protein [Candidatus Aminicenantes bacterium]